MEKNARNSPLRSVSEKLIKLPVSLLSKVPSIKADHITLAGLGLVIGGAGESFFSHFRQAGSWVGFGLMAVGISCDALDGAVARALNQSSPQGALLDLMVDRTEESAMVLSRIASAAARKDVLGIIAATAVGLVGPIPSLLRAKIEAEGGVSAESGKNPLSFLGTRPARAVAGVFTTAFPTMIEGELSFQAGVDSLMTLANIITSIERFVAAKKTPTDIKDGTAAQDSLTALGKEKLTHLKRFILFNNLFILSAGIVGLVYAVNNQ